MIISLNIRGVNSPHKKYVLIKLIRDHKPNIIMLHNAKMLNRKIERIKLYKNLGMEGSDSSGASMMHGGRKNRITYNM